MIDKPREAAPEVAEVTAEAEEADSQEEALVLKEDKVVTTLDSDKDSEEEDLNKAEVAFAINR